MQALVDIEGKVQLWQFTAEELAERDRRFITETIITYMAAANPPPPANSYVKAPQAIKLLAPVKKLSHNTVFKYCMDNGINAKTIGNGAKRTTYTYNELDIYNHVKKHTHGR